MTQPRITRRAILRAGAVGAAVVTLPLRLVDVLAQATATNTWTFSQWSSLVGSSFRVSLADGTTTQVKLASATNLMPAGSSTTSGPQCYALSFSGALQVPSAGSTQSFYNARVGTVQLFATPGSATSSGQHVGAIVNRL